jgi:hypothetical protein
VHGIKLAYAKPILRPAQSCHLLIRLRLVFSGSCLNTEPKKSAFRMRDQCRKDAPR